MAANLTSDEDSVKETVEKIYEYFNQSKRSPKKAEYLKALKRFNEAYLTSVPKNTKSKNVLFTREFSTADFAKSYEELIELLEKSEVSSEKLLTTLKELSSKDSHGKTIEELKESLEKSEVSSQKETKDKSSLKLLLEELLNESSNRIDHLEKLREKKIALLKSI